MSLPNIVRSWRFRRQVRGLDPDELQAFATWARHFARAEADGRLGAVVGDRAGRRATYRVSPGLLVTARIRVDQQGRMAEAKLYSIRRD